MCVKERERNGTNTFQKRYLQVLGVSEVFNGNKAFSCFFTKHSIKIKHTLRLLILEEGRDDSPLLVPFFLGETLCLREPKNIFIYMYYIVIYQCIWQSLDIFYKITFVQFLEIMSVWLQIMKIIKLTWRWCLWSATRITSSISTLTSNLQNKILRCKNGYKIYEEIL